LLKNPILVFNKFENKDSLEYYSVFIILNINYINQEPDIKTKLINFFLSLYYKKKSVKTTIISLIHLQILYFGLISYLGIHMFEDDTTLTEICDMTNTFFIKEPSMNISFLKLLLDDYLKKYKTVKDFMHGVNETLSITDKTESDTEMVSILKRHHKIYTEISDDMKISNSYDNTFIKLLFGVSDYIYVIESSDGSFIYLISLEYYIKIVFDVVPIKPVAPTNFRTTGFVGTIGSIVRKPITSTKLIINKIKEIFYNGNIVLNPSEIKLPFINILPVAGFYLIYEKDGKYYVISFIHDNLQLTGDNNVLDPMRFKSRVLTIPISTVNRNYPDTPEGWKNLDYLIEAYGYNPLNCFFVNVITNNGYVITKNEMKYVKQKYLTFEFKNMISKDENDIPFDLSEDILDIQQSSHPKDFEFIISSLLVIGQITDDEYSMMSRNAPISDNDSKTYKSCIKLSHKVNKLSLKTLPIVTELGDYQSDTDKLMESLKGLNTFTAFKDDILTYMPYIRYIKRDSLLKSLSTNTDSKSDEYYKKSLLASNMDLFKSRKYKYEYFFEYFFEFIFGTPTEEQFQIYKKIISNYDDIQEKYQKKIISTTTDTGNRFQLVNRTMYGGKMINANGDMVKEKNQKNITVSSNKNRFKLVKKDMYGGIMGSANGDIVKEKNQKMITASSTKNRFKLVKTDMYGGVMLSINDVPTTIQHVMMGKGKSCVLTPLLTMYFVLNYGKIVYIIIPEHLKKQTLKIMEPYIKIFNMNTVKIMTNIELYVLFLEENIESDSIFLIDEIDSLVDPLKSNFNLIQTHKKKSEVLELYEKIVSYSGLNDSSSLTDTDKMLYDDIRHHKENLDKGILKYNINWGIHPTKAHAIPFISKDKPALESTFSSIVLTLILTMYYYYKIDNTEANKLPSFLKTFIRYNKISYKYGLNKIDLSDEDLDTLYDKKSEIIKDIISTIQMTETQFNISFVDILLKDDIYKIGYSGTVNVEFPQVEHFKYEIYEDKDEVVNIAYALSQARIVIGSETDISEYDAYIDICGHFKDKSNEDQARKFKDLGKCDIIFIDEYDDVKYIDTKNEVLPYSDNVLLDKPKIYFDQGHTVGIDIKQDRYPDMKALCYVSLDSKYSEVAQGMYRMRKLNAGQTVDLFLVDPDKDGTKMTISQLYKLFRDNQANYISASKPLLNFQTVKAIVRKEQKKEKKGQDKKMDMYCETVKYYFEGFDSYTLEGILNGNYTTLLIQYGLDSKKLKELVYNMKSNCNQIQQQKQQVYQEQHTNAIYKKKYKFNHMFNINYSDSDGMKQIFNNCIRCSNKVYFLIDIFDKYENKNGFCFVKPNTTDNLLLICAKHSIYFLKNDYKLYTLYLEPLNEGEQIFDKYIKEDVFIQAIFGIADKLFKQSDEFKVVLYTVLFTLKSEIPIHLKYMDQLTKCNIPYYIIQVDSYTYNISEMD
jgi:hypothetical protein